MDDEVKALLIGRFGDGLGRDIIIGESKLTEWAADFLASRLQTIYRKGFYATLKHRRSLLRSARPFQTAWLYEIDDDVPTDCIIKISETHHWGHHARWYFSRLVYLNMDGKGGSFRPRLRWP